MNQDQPKPELTFDESVKQVMQTLPPVVRDYLIQGKYTTVAKILMDKYGLRIDQGGVLEREIMLLLMGIDDPTEFAQALAEEARLGQEAIQRIAQDVNDQIFVPLQAEMRKGGAGQQPRPVGAPVPSYARPAQTPGVIGPPPQSPSYFHLENKIPAPPKAMQGAVPVRPTQSSGRPPVSNSASLPPKSVLPRPAGASRPGLDPKRLLEDHEEPHIDIKGAETPLQQALRTVLPRPSVAPGVVGPPPPNLPGVITHPPLTPPTPIAPPQPPLPPTLPKPIPPAAPPAPPVSPAPPKPYSADPYREPIDEK